VKAAQIAIAVLAGVLIAAGTLLLITDRTVSGWIMGGFGLTGYVSLLGMIAAQRVDRRTGP